jgi:tetratricopeptide (TPR) repeat protein
MAELTIRAPETKQEALSRGLKHQRAGDLALAEQTYRELLRCHPEVALAWFLLGQVAFQKGAVPLAIKLMERAIADEKTEAAFHHNLGMVHASQKEWTQARACFQEAIRLKPDFMDAHIQLGKTLSALGMEFEAIALYRQAVALRPRSAAALKNLANGLAAVGDYEGMGCLLQVREVPQERAREKNAEGMSLVQRGQLEEAAVCFRAAIQISPNYAAARGNLGNLLAAAGKREEAAACYQQVAALHPSDAGVPFNLAGLLRAEDRIAEAIEHYRRAIALRPDFVHAHNNLGTALMSQGNLDEAIACFQMAMKLQPEFVGACHNLAVAQGRRASMSRSRPVVA